MWRPRTSPASTRVIASTAALLAAEAASIGNVEPTAEPARLTIVPPSRRCRAACRLTRNVPRTLVRCKASNLSRSWSATGPRMTWPAAWTRMSMPPKASVVSTNIRSTSSSSATSARDRERGPACGEDLLDDAVGRTLVPDVADDNGVAPVRELAHDLPADTPRAAGDDRYTLRAGEVIVVVRDQAVTLSCERRPSHQGMPWPHPWSSAQGRNGSQAPRAFRGRTSERQMLGPALGECPQGRPDARSARRASGTPAACPAYRVRPLVWRCSGPVPGRVGVSADCAGSHALRRGGSYRGAAGPPVGGGG